VIEKRSLKKTSVQTAVFIPFSIDSIKEPFNSVHEIHQISGDLGLGCNKVVGSWIGSSA
jgi:hypothetical protein